ncbi:MAG: response regulator transcription factor [Ignavibacteriales bacterium]|nr:response regulator transcription factor [Ignavibacteriales bacterium]
MKSKIKVIVADDHPIFRKGLIDIIELEKDIEILGHAANGEEAVNLIKRVLPDIAVLDINMPMTTGFDAVRELRKGNSLVKIIFLTMHNEQEIFKRAMELNVSGYLLKDSAAEDIIDCIHVVAKGDFYFSPALSNYFVTNQRGIFGTLENTGTEKLTSTEKTILRLIANGKTSQEIADQLFVSRKTIDNHRVNICAKLDLHGVNALMKYAIQNKANL